MRFQLLQPDVVGILVSALQEMLIAQLPQVHGRVASIAARAMGRMQDFVPDLLQELESVAKVGRDRVVLKNEPYIATRGC
jgi:hypothetical protein